jgi:hypothetical protein
MRTRLCTLLVVGLLLVTTPVLAAPERAAAQDSASIDALLHRLLGPILNLFGADEDDNGPTVDPNGLAEPLPEEGDNGPTVDPNGLGAPADPETQSKLVPARGAWRR